MEIGKPEKIHEIELDPMEAPSPDFDEPAPREEPKEEPVPVEEEQEVEV